MKRVPIHVSRPRWTEIIACVIFGGTSANHLACEEKRKNCAKEEVTKRFGLKVKTRFFALFIISYWSLFGDNLDNKTGGNGLLV